MYIAGMKKIPAFLFFILACAGSFSQPTIKGKVINVANNTPVAGSSVFISNTSKGTTTDKNGYFELNDVPAGKHDLVISCIGYETNVFSFASEKLPLSLKIEMAVRVKELQNVTVEPFVEEGWDKWGRLFTERFIGRTPNAAQCKIKNTDAIRFRFFRKSNRLVAYSDEQLILENKALGYRIIYQMESFEVDFKTTMTFFSGYPLFEEMERNRKKWIRNRDEAYYGSIQHFMHSLYRDSLKQQGFEVRRMVRIPNTEKERVKKLYRELHQNRVQTGMAGVVITQNAKQDPPAVEKDSMDYYQRILQQKDYTEIYGKELLTADSLIVSTEGDYKIVFFNDYLYVTYKNEMEDPEYLHSTGEQRSRFFQRSYLRLPNGNPVAVDRNGGYFPPQEMFSSAYWGWSEKMADCVPIDYVPSKD